MTWSDGATSISAPGSRAASASGGGQDRGGGVARLGLDQHGAGAMPAAASCSVTMKRKSAPVTTIGGAKPGPDSRRAEAWNRLSSPVRVANCLG
jgi:hypothetical protein